MLILKYKKYLLHLIAIQKRNNITLKLHKNQFVNNRNDLIVRVFRLKYNKLICVRVEDKIFGKVASYFGSTKFQKRNLLDMHFYLILD